MFVSEEETSIVIHSDGYTNLNINNSKVKKLKH